jgi:hypothetical protein
LCFTVHLMIIRHILHTQRHITERGITQNANTITVLLSDVQNLGTMILNFMAT